MHYFGNDINDNDEDEDMKLPFKKITTPGHISHAVHPAKTILFRQPYFSITAAIRRPQLYILSNPALGALFRPPRA